MKTMKNRYESSCSKNAPASAQLTLSNWTLITRNRRLSTPIVDRPRPLTSLSFSGRLDRMSLISETAMKPVRSLSKTRYASRISFSESDSCIFFTIIT